MKIVPALALSSCLLMAAGAAAADLTVTVAGVRNADGAVRVTLYDKPDGFRHEDKARLVASAPARSGEVAVVFPGLAAGTYAVIAYHDENGNGGLDKFMGMVPTEGFALSNDPEVLGPPSFDSAAFTLGGADETRVVHLKY
jgi:Uncharacterized protein conserved in bacteria